VQRWEVLSMTQKGSLKQPRRKQEMTLMEFTQEEAMMLTADGFEPGFMMDIREDDLVAIPPVSRFTIKENEAPATVKTVVVKRKLTVDGTYMDENDEIVPNRIVTFIGNDLDGIPGHYSFGHTYPCFFKRE
jgi:hypothetical protein